MLVDATYEPVNALSKRGRDIVIEQDYLELCADLKRLLAGRWREVPLILIKANVCRLLGPKLKENGFNVLNKGRIVYFPANGQQRVFERQFREIVPQTLRGTKQAYEIEGIRADETTFAVEVLECQSEDEAKGLAQHCTDLWRCTVKLYRVPFVNTGIDPRANEQKHFICRIEPTSPPGHSA